MQPNLSSHFRLKFLLPLLVAFTCMILYSTLYSNQETATTNSTENIFSSHQKQAELLVKKMTPEEKVGQMLLPTINLLANDKSPQALERGKIAWSVEKDLHALGKICGLDGIKKYHIGAILQDGSPLAFSGDDQSLASWQKLSTIANLFYDGPKGTRLLLGTDAIHGDQHITGTILFPHNIGLGATHNPALVQLVAHWTMRNIALSGFNWSFMPTVTIARDYRWGRTYESFSEIPEVVKSLSYHYVLGLQNRVDNHFQGVLGSVKHFIGDGDTKNGQDEGEVYTDNLEQFWISSGVGYEGAVEADVGSLMVSYSSLNGIPMHFGGADNLLKHFLEKGLVDRQNRVYRFDGFAVSDFVGVSRAAYKYNQLHSKKISYVEAVAKAVNAGIDMLMIANGAYENPLDYNPQPPYEMRSKTYYDSIQTVRDSLLAAVNQGLISPERLDEAVIRILRTKLSLAHQEPTALSDADRQEEAKISLQAAEQSLVLLKNQADTLPVKQENVKYLFLLGDYDDIGVQNGGWTVTWQGQKGNKYWRRGSKEKQLSFATSLLDGVKALLGKDTHFYEGEKSFVSADLSHINPANSVALIAISEPPYAEYMGDVDNQNPFYIKGALLKENIYMPTKQSQFLGITYSDEQLQAIRILKKQGVKIITILFSGRPLVITEPQQDSPLSQSDAFIAAFLPGTSGGQALANAIFGKYAFKSHQSEIEGKTYFSNTLPFAWPASMEEVRNHQYTLFPVGYGLKTQAHRE